MTQQANAQVLDSTRSDPTTADLTTTAPTAPRGPALTERHILAAANLNSKLSPWRLHQILSGLAPVDQSAPSDRLADLFRRGLGAHLKDVYDVKVSRYQGPNDFVEPFHVNRPTLIEDPGALEATPGTVLMIETPSRAAYEFSWKINYDAVVPLGVVARANLRMHISGAQNALVWVIADNGEISEFHMLAYDPKLVAELEAACRTAITRADSGDEPAPDDPDLADYFRQHSSLQSNSIKICEPSSPEAQAFNTYRRLDRERAEAEAAARTAKTKLDQPKKTLMQAMKDVPTLQIDNHIVTLSVINIAEQHRKASSYTKLNIKQIRETDD